MSDELLDTSPGLKDYGRQVRELLDRYVELSGGLLKLEIIRPQPFSTEEDRAVGFGLQGIPITQAGNLGYFGLAGTNTLTIWIQYPSSQGRENLFWSTI